MDKYTIENLELFYGDFKALKGINLNIKENEITAFIGPSGCGDPPSQDPEQDERSCRGMAG